MAIEHYFVLEILPFVTSTLPIHVVKVSQLPVTLFAVFRASPSRSIFAFKHIAIKTKLFLYQILLFSFYDCDKIGHCLLMISFDLHFIFNRELKGKKFQQFCFYLWLAIKRKSGVRRKDIIAILKQRNLWK